MIVSFGSSIHPAAAQSTLTLQSGDNVTVGGRGTTGTYQGQFINYTTNFYTSSSPYAPGVYVDAGSSFILQPGGSVVNSSTGLGISSLGSVTINGGTVTGGIGASGSATVNAGTISGSYSALGFNSGTLTIHGGNFSSSYNGGAAINFQGDGTVTVSGGSFSSPGSGLFSAQSGTVMISGGNFSGGFYGLFVAGNLVEVSGASVSANAPGGSGFHVDTGTLDLFGTFYDGSGNLLTSPIYIASLTTITGTFLNGQPVDTTFDDNSGIIEFNVGIPPAPEPSQFAALGLGVIGLSALALRARRRMA